MKYSLIVSLVTSFALFASPVTAGAPDNPGAGGQRVKAAVEEAKGLGLTWGEIVSDTVQTSDETLGGLIQETKDSFGGSPNPANDNGGGND